jgi:cadmium resistance transport/sequestration family protein
MLSTLIAAIASFAATNIDDIFILTLFFSQHTRRWQIVLGQYLGFTGLIGISLAGFFGGRLLPHKCIGLLGVVPIAIGIKKLFEKRSGEKRQSTSGVLSVAAVTFANGGDNIGIYAPLFATMSAPRLLLTLMVFYVLLAMWCLAGYLITRHPAVGKILDRYGHIIVPFVLIGLGIYIIASSR